MTTENFIIEPWAIWLIIAGLLLVVEMLSGSVVALCLSIGCIVSMIVAGLGLTLIPQLLAMIVISILALIFLGPVIRQIYSKNRHGEKAATNMDAIIGRVGKVTHRVTNNADDRGRVQIDGDSWLAYTNSPQQPLERGCQVIVESYDSIVLCVKPVK